MHKHENGTSPLVNLQKTKQAPSYVVPVFLGLLTVSYYGTTKMPVGLGDAWSPLAKGCTWKATDATTRAGGTRPWRDPAHPASLPIQQRAVISHARRRLLANLFGLFISVHIIWRSRKPSATEDRLMPCPAVADRMYEAASSLGRCAFCFSPVSDCCPTKQIIICVFTSEGSDC